MGAARGEGGGGALSFAGGGEPAAAGAGGIDAETRRGGDAERKGRRMPAALWVEWGTLTAKGREGTLMVEGVGPSELKQRLRGALRSDRGNQFVFRATFYAVGSTENGDSS